MENQHRSLDGNKHAQVLATEDFFTAVYPMESKSMTGQGLKESISEYGTPDKVICNSAGEHTGKISEFMQQIRKQHIDLQLVEPGRHNRSKVEGMTRELWKRWFHVMVQIDVPKQLWDYGMRWVSKVMQRMASNAGSLDWHTPPEKITGEMQEISEYLDLGFYDWC